MLKKASLQIVDSGKMEPAAIMAKDSLLLEQLHADDPPTIHFYDWSVPSLTYGYFTDPACYLNLDALHECGLHLARRPTGGGIIFHLADFAFSVLLPASHPSFSHNTMENYAFINLRVAQAISALAPLSAPLHLLPHEHYSNRESPSFCMAKPTPYDLIIERKKVGGAAQRRTKKGLLHQATLSLCLPSFNLLGKVLKDPQVIASMKENSYCLFPAENDLQAGRRKIKELLSLDLLHNL